MRFNTDKIEWTESMKEFAESVITKKLDRVIENPSDAEIKITKLNEDELKLTLCVAGLRAQVVDSDFYMAVTAVAAKIKSIATKAKAKKANPRYKQISMADLGVFDEVEQLPDLISKEKTFELKPTTIECAIDELECTDYPFYVFKDADADDIISIIYRRYNNTYGLIRCN